MLLFVLVETACFKRSQIQLKKSRIQLVQLDLTLKYHNPFEEASDDGACSDISSALVG